MDEETKYSFIWEKGFVDGRYVKLYRLTQWSKNKVENAASQNELNSLRDELEAYKEIIDAIAKPYFKQRVLAVLDDGKARLVNQIASRMIIRGSGQFWSQTVDALTELESEERIERLNNGRYRIKN